jgi:hypothetical protein
MRLAKGTRLQMKKGDRSNEAAELLLANARDFLSGGIDLLFRKGATSRDAKLAVISIQTAVELFAKYRIVRDLGFSDIVRKGVIPRGGDLLVAAGLGHFTTIGYDACLEKVADLEWIGEWQRNLIGELQKMRNTLVHFAGTLEAKDARNTVAALLVQVLALFAAGQARDNPEMLTHRQFLDGRSFEVLTTHPEYLVEAYDAASSDLNADAIFTCWNCKQETLTLRPADTYFCWTCGLSAHKEVAGFAPCWQCHQENVVCYDRLNETGGTHYGRCLSCNSTAFVSYCGWCGAIKSEAAPQELEKCRCREET